MNIEWTVNNLTTYTLKYIYSNENIVIKIMICIFASTYLREFFHLSILSNQNIEHGQQTKISLIFGVSQYHKLMLT